MIGGFQKDNKEWDNDKVRLTQFKKGHKPWNKNKIGVCSDETKKKMRDAWIIRRLTPVSEETRKKLSEVGMGRISPMKGKDPWNKNKKLHYDVWMKGKKGMHLSPETEFKKGQFLLEKHHNWQGGKSFEPYSPEFNKELKEEVRKRDNYECQECHYTQKQLGYKLSVHHIDYNKKNNIISNLISLCKSCHTQTNFKREDWSKYFINKLKNN